MKPRTVLRPAENRDVVAIKNLLASGMSVHRHLDWRAAFEWIGCDPFWVMEENGMVEAALACPPEDGVAWVRLFACSTRIHPHEAWEQLFTKAYPALVKHGNIPLFVLTLQEWMEMLVKKHGFSHKQDIVVLSWQSSMLKTNHIDNPSLVRAIAPEDLENVIQVDHAAFDPLWQISHDAMQRALQANCYATLAESDGKIAGYQITTVTPFNAHLARLAVHPDLQHRHIGRLILNDVLQHFKDSNVEITLNTQQDNHASLALYLNSGFRYTGESFPVWEYHPLQNSTQVAK